MRDLFKYETPHTLIKAAQKQVAAIGERGFRAQSRKDPRELHGDVAAADDQHTIRERWQIKRFVGRDGEFAAWKVWHHRPATSGDQDVTCRDALATDVDGVFALQHGAVLEQIHASILQQPAINAVQALDFTGLVVAKRWPVEIRRPRLPTVAVGVGELFAELRTVDEQLLRHAADVDAGSPQIAFLRASYAGAKRRGHSGSANAARSRTDDE